MLCKKNLDKDLALYQNEFRWAHGPALQFNSSTTKLGVMALLIFTTPPG
jgi:hypothetical protein